MLTLYFAPGDWKSRLHGQNPPTRVSKRSRCQIIENGRNHCHSRIRTGC
ncbi:MULTISPECIES: hypothetical protein [unclassified Nostoc]|nr:hypothetical protein [Nostoc sp. 'Peltigera membranacea cyanobiont' 213]